MPHTTTAEPATALHVATTAGPLLALASRHPIDVVLRSALTWPILQHAAWCWRLHEPGDDPTLHWALALQLRADLMEAWKIAVEAYRLGQRGAPMGSLYPRIRKALETHVDGADDQLLPAPLDTRHVLVEASRTLDCVPDDLLIKAQLALAVTLAREDGYSTREITDLFVSQLEALMPTVLQTYGAPGASRNMACRNTDST